MDTRMRFQSLSRMIARAIRIATIGAALAAPAEAGGRWPRVIPLDKAKLVIYQPQIESLEGVILSGRVAVSWEPEGGGPMFGVVWFDARILADKDSREVQIEEYTVRKVRFPESTPEQEKKLETYLEQEVPKWDLRPSLDELEKSLGALPKTLFFQYQNIDELTDYLSEHHEEELQGPAREASVPTGAGSTGCRVPRES